MIGGYCRVRAGVAAEPGLDGSDGPDDVAEHGAGLLLVGGSLVGRYAVAAGLLIGESDVIACCCKRSVDSGL